MSSVSSRNHTAVTRKIKSVPFYTPRIWHGRTIGSLFQLFAQNRYRMHFTKYPMAMTSIMLSSANSLMAAIQKSIYGQAIEQTELVDDPIFVLGHWRSGTTYLHELMSLDSRLGSPTTYQCFTPRHFLVSEWFFKRLLWCLLPSKRPMDNVKFGWDAPQEDEFALCNLGLPSTYSRIAFPNHPPRHLDYLSMYGIPDRELDQWKMELDRFVRAVSLRCNKRIVLKSPPHTGRIGVLKEMFPQARFIHISRNPYQVIPSTIHLWKTLDHVNAFQIPTNEGMEDYVFECFDRLYRGYNRYRETIGPSQLIEIRYEDLIESPLLVLENIYCQLDLGGFEDVQQHVEAKLAKNKNFRTNQHVVPDDLAEQIGERCANYLEQFGYQLLEAAS